MKVIILSDESVKSQMQELARLIKTIGFVGEIKHFDYYEYFSLEENDKLFVICPSNPDVHLPYLPRIAFEAHQIIPVYYQGSEKSNVPLGLQSIVGLPISGEHFPFFIMNNLSLILRLPNLCTNYTDLIRKNSSSKALYKSTFTDILEILSNLEMAQGRSSSVMLDHIGILNQIQNLKDITLQTAKELKDVLVSLSESEQRKISDSLKDTPLGECLEKLEPEATAIATTSFSL